MSLLVLMGIKKEDKSRICFAVAEGTAPVEGGDSTIITAVEADYSEPYRAGVEIAKSLLAIESRAYGIRYHNGWGAGGVYFTTEKLSPFDEDRFMRGFRETFERIPLDRRA